MAAEPTPGELRAFLDDGGTQLQAAERWEISRNRVQRILKGDADERGPVELAVAAVIDSQAEHDGLNLRQTARAEMLRAAAIVVDKSAASGTGVAWSAFSQALTRLWEMLEEFAPDDAFDRHVAALGLFPMTDEEAREFDALSVDERVAVGSRSQAAQNWKGIT
jgi:hypothetical protein